jgi:hypothetical protein
MGVDLHQEFEPYACVQTAFGDRASIRKEADQAGVEIQGG